MGFSVTAAHAILLIAALGAGGAFAGAFLGAVEDQAAGDAAAAKAAVRTRETEFGVVETGGFPNYNAGTSRFKVQILNDGPVPVEVSKLTHVVDGTVMTTTLIEKAEVQSSPQSDLLLPGEKLEVWFRPIAPAPTRYLAVTADGAAAGWWT